MEGEFPSCEQYYEVPEAIGLDDVDLEKYNRRDWEQLRKSLILKFGLPKIPTSSTLF